MNSSHGSIPLKYASLIIRYTHNLLSDAEGEELDKWLEDSDDNLQIFEELTDGMEGKIFSADNLIIETDDLLDTWMIAGLMARQMQGIITRDEERALQNWVKESEHNKALYELFTNKANLHKFVMWLKQLKGGDRPADLN